MLKKFLLVTTAVVAVHAAEPHLLTLMLMLEMHLVAT